MTHLFRKKSKEPACRSNREQWIGSMQMLAKPVLSAAKQGVLHRTFPEPASRLAAAAGVICGTASFLESLSGKQEASQYTPLLRDVQDLLNAIITSGSPDCCLAVPTNYEPTEVVPCNGLLAFALLKSKTVLLKSAKKDMLLQYFRNAKKSRPCLAREDLLFGAMIELVIYEISGSCDTQNLDYTINMLMHHNRGNGVFAPSGQYRWSYEHTFFLYPMMEVLCSYLPLWFDRQKTEAWKKAAASAFERMCTIQMRMIAPDGSFPVFGPEVWLRCGAFHTLAHGAAVKKLPKDLPYACAREALTSIMERTLTPAGTADEAGFLLPGLCGSQPSLCSPGFLRGKLYGCMTVFAPLGLPASHAFWNPADKSSPWQQVWSGQNIPLDCH